MAEKVLFFTAGPKATTQELAEITKINQAAQAPFVVGIRNAQAGVSYGYGPEETDYVAGSPPAPYDNTGGTVSVAIEDGEPTFTYTPD